MAAARPSWSASSSFWPDLLLPSLDLPTLATRAHAYLGTPVTPDHRCVCCSSSLRSRSSMSCASIALPASPTRAARRPASPGVNSPRPSPGARHRWVQRHSDGLLARFSRLSIEDVQPALSEPQKRLYRHGIVSLGLPTAPGSASLQGSKLATGYSSPSSRSTRLSPGVR